MNGRRLPCLETLRLEKLHLDKLDADRALLLVKNGDGADLKTVPLP